MKTFIVFGNWGEVTANAETGEVLHYEPGVDALDPKAVAECVAAGVPVGYADIARFDVDEWRSHYPGEECNGGDILDFGYWLLNGTYEGPAEDWREAFAAIDAELEPELSEDCALDGRHSFEDNMDFGGAPGQRD